MRFNNMYHVEMLIIRINIPSRVGTCLRRSCGMRFIAGSRIAINRTRTALFRLTARELAVAVLITTISAHHPTDIAT